MTEKTENQIKKEEKLKEKRTFPVGYTVLLVVIVLAQIGLVFLGIAYQPKPQDVIRQYNVFVEPRNDGTLDITYRIRWEALDESEALTWVQIGMANSNYYVYPGSVSSNIRTYRQQVDEDYVSLRLDFDQSYYGGDVIDFSFKVNQKDMLCMNEAGYFYEFVPGWFNAIQVEQYTFQWKMENGQDYFKRGSLDYGEYRKMTVQYGPDAFAGCHTVQYRPFDDEGAYNELAEDKGGIIAMCCVFAAILIVPEVYIIDCYVSYSRGRGFIVEYGAHVHTHGRINPGYTRARAAHGGRSGGRGGGGCACACACACAGGGRAGCSQKDTYGNTEKDTGEQ